MHERARPTLNVEHWATFQKHMDHPVIWPGKCPRGLGASVQADDALLSGLPDVALTREDVKAFCCNERNSDEACFLVIMAWGGMRVSNARRAWHARDRWLGLIRAIRQGALSGRSDAFHALLLADVPGMRIAYFTKLMYFLCSGPACYILDQWTARSTNLLCLPGAPLVQLQQNYVKNDNPASVYLGFCDLVDRLADATGRTGEQIEQSMFAGGRGHPWRAVVRKFG